MSTPATWGSALTGSEGRATLEVDEDEGEVVRRGLEGERQHEGAEELGLARPGGPTDEHVRSVGHEVDGEGAVRDHTDPGPWEPVRCRPSSRDVRSAERPVTAHDLLERDAGREASATGGRDLGERRERS